MINTPLLISILVFIAIELFGLGIFYYINYRKEHRKLIEKIKGKTEEVRLEETTDTYTQDYGVLKKQFLKIATFLGHHVKPRSEGDISHIRKTLLKAGFQRENALVILFGVKTLLAILLSAGFFLLKILFIKAIPPVYFLVFSISFALIGFYLPNLWLQIKIARRKKKFLEGFPDALDLMVVCVEAGMGLDAVINRVGEEMKFSNKVLSEEFKFANLELRAGMLRRDALRNLSHRTGLEEVSSLVSLLIQTDKFGTSLAQALRVHVDYMRTKRHQKAEEIAQKLPIKLVFPLILFIFPALFITILGPAAIKIYRSLLPRF